jgi:hypothetical protein
MMPGIVGYASELVSVCCGDRRVKCVGGMRVWWARCWHSGHVKTGRKPFTGGKLRLISTWYRSVTSVFGILRPVLRHGRMSLHPVATAVRRSRCGALLWIQARVQGHVRFVDRDGCREVDKSKDVSG